MKTKFTTLLAVALVMGANLCLALNDPPTEPAEAKPPAENETQAAPQADATVVAAPAESQSPGEAETKPSGEAETKPLAGPNK